MPLPNARTLRYADLRWQDTAVEHRSRSIILIRLSGELSSGRRAARASHPRSIAQRQHALSRGQRRDDIRYGDRRFSE
jgi:hypothetical protein